MSVPLQGIEAASHQPGRGVAYQSFAEPGRSAPAPPAFLFGALPAFLAPDLFAEFGVGGAGCYRISGACVSSDGVILQAGEALWSLALNHPDYLVRAITGADQQNRAALPIRHVPGQAALIHGPGYMVFGHWLVDFLPRLHLLQLAGFSIETLPFILPSDTPGFARTLLHRIGIPPHNIIEHDHRCELIAPDELVVPTILRLKSRLSPLFAPATKTWTDRFAAGNCGMRADPVGRLFLSRHGASDQRRLKNRAEIETIATASGYQVVCPETLSLDEQMSLFGSASHIAGEYGSGLHGAIFARPGAILCALRGTSHHPGFVQSGLAQVLLHRLGYVFGATPEHATDQHFEIDPRDFTRALEAMELCGAKALVTP